ncbi:hypothetical protein ACHAPU_008068 [Fusarium lateritium]
MSQVLHFTARQQQGHDLLAIWKSDFHYTHDQQASLNAPGVNTEFISAPVERPFTPTRINMFPTPRWDRPEAVWESQNQAAVYAQNTSHQNDRLVEIQKLRTEAD